MFPASFYRKILAVLSYLWLIILSSLSAQPLLYNTHWTSNTDPGLSSGTAGSVSTLTIDTICSQIGISITDTANAPLPAFNAYTLDPKDSLGNDITDLSDNMMIYARVRSLDSVRLAVLLRSGGGGSSERTDRVEVIVPGDTTNWHEFTFAFDASNLAGFDSLDFRDIWIYLDRGDDNFAGNAFYIDYVSIGGKPDSSTYSTCGNVPPPPPPVFEPIYISHWETTNGPNFSSGTAGSVSTVTFDPACSQVLLSVTDTVNGPLPPFNAYFINPQDSTGNDITDLSGNLRLYARVRSLDTVRMAVLLRGGGGTSTERTDRIEVVVPGDTSNWHEYSFIFDSNNLGGFDSLDLRDIWIYLDRGVNNFCR